MRSWIAGVIGMVLILGGVSCVNAQQESSLLGKKAPDFTLERLSGKPASLSAVIKDKKAIIFFFATWCPHCREQLKELMLKKADLQSQGIEVVLINAGESKDVVSRFLTLRGIDYDAFLDVESFVAELYQVVGIPTLVFIGNDGKVRYVEYGLPDNYEEILK